MNFLKLKKKTQINIRKKTIINFASITLNPNWLLGFYQNKTNKIIQKKKKSKLQIIKLKTIQNTVNKCPAHQERFLNIIFHF